MDPCTAMVISKMGEDLDIFGLAELSSDLIFELEEEARINTNAERIVELHKDIFEIRSIIENSYEKKYGEKLVWKSKKSL